MIKSQKAGTILNTPNDLSQMQGLSEISSRMDDPALAPLTGFMASFLFNAAEALDERFKKVNICSLIATSSITAKNVILTPEKLDTPLSTFSIGILLASVVSKILAKSLSKPLFNLLDSDSS